MSDDRDSIFNLPWYFEPPVVFLAGILLGSGVTLLCVWGVL